MSRYLQYVGNRHSSLKRNWFSILNPWDKRGEQICQLLDRKFNYKLAINFYQKGYSNNRFINQKEFRMCPYYNWLIKLWHNRQE